MATGAKIGKRTQFLRENTIGGGVYSVCAEVKSIGGPTLNRDAVEATNMDSPDDHAEYIGGVADGGEISLVLNFRPDHASQGSSAGLAKDYFDGEKRGYQVQWPQFSNVPTMTVQGILTGYEVTSATKDLLTVAVKIKVTGKPVVTNFA
jgi:predicted secreted protein